MLPSTPRTPALDTLVRRLDEAVSTRDEAGRCRVVKEVLAGVLAGCPDFLAGPLVAPRREGYARRLLHVDPSGRYSALVMVWDVGQRTPLHDHAGMWCVEGVYRGTIEVVSFAVRGGDPERGIVDFDVESTVRAGVGEAGWLIPPFEHHVLRNAGEVPAVTIHVYGGEMTHCHVFDPVPDGRWQRRRVDLPYTT